MSPPSGVIGAQKRRAATRACGPHMQVVYMPNVDSLAIDS